LIGQVSGNDRINRAKIYEKRGINMEHGDNFTKEVKNEAVFGGPA
jgi:3-deoxy-D-manno-octulosonic acid (KDO) 8-phosphate synthase